MTSVHNIQSCLFHLLNKFRITTEIMSMSMSCQCFAINLCKQTVCQPFINTVWASLTGTQGKGLLCMHFGVFPVILFVGHSVIWLVTLMLRFSLFGNLSQQSRTSSSSRRRWESVMNLMYWLVSVISSLYLVLSVTYWRREKKNPQKHLETLNFL